MGLYHDKKDALPARFSFSDFCEACHYSELDHKEARNQLRSFARRGYVKRVSRNNYMKLVA